MSKWNSEYWEDFAERVGTTLLYGLIAYFSLDGTDTMVGTWEQFWGIVGIPVVLSVLKNLLMNLKGEKSSASLVGITSNKEV